MYYTCLVSTRYFYKTNCDFKIKEKHVCDVHMSCSKGKLNFYKFIQASPHIQVLFENEVFLLTTSVKIWVEKNSPKKATI